MAMGRNWNVFQGVRRLDSLVVVTKVKDQASVNGKYCEHTKLPIILRDLSVKEASDYTTYSLEEQVALGILITDSATEGQNMPSGERRWL